MVSFIYKIDMQCYRGMIHALVSHLLFIKAMDKNRNLRVQSIGMATLKTPSQALH